MRQLKIADLYCGGGGAARGLSNVDFAVIGVDIKPQPYYPFPFIEADVMSLDADWFKGFDAIWASPPCQRYSLNAIQHQTVEDHPDLIVPTRELLDSTGLPYVIENIPNAPIRKDLLLCGSMFGLRLIRHRIFESNIRLTQLEHGDHHPYFITVTGHPGGNSSRDGNAHLGTMEEWQEVMEIDWLPARTLAEAVPPAYAEHIGIDLRVGIG